MIPWIISQPSCHRVISLWHYTAACTRSPRVPTADATPPGPSPSCPGEHGQGIPQGQRRLPAGMWGDLEAESAATAGPGTNASREPRLPAAPAAPRTASAAFPRHSGGGSRVRAARERLVAPPRTV